MAQFTITVDDTLATATLEGKTPEQVVTEYATGMATKVCQDPYYTGPIPPQFNADGTLYEEEGRE